MPVHSYNFIYIANFSRETSFLHFTYYMAAVALMQSQPLTSHMNSKVIRVIVLLLLLMAFILGVSYQGSLVSRLTGLERLIAS